MVNRADHDAAPTLPAAAYHGAESLERDLRGVFDRSWLCLGLAPSHPGSYRSEVVAGRPVVVVRDQDGRLHALANVCAHRAGPLVENDDAGRCSSLICGYHGWIYELDGRLRSARGSGLQLDADDIALHRHAVEEWRGLVFVSFAPAPEPLLDWLDPDFVERCAPYPIEQWSPVERLDHDMAADWKTYADNYLEGYHIPFVHPELARTIDVASYRVDAAGRSAQHTARRRDGDDSDGTWLWHWPNLALNLYEHGGSVERWWPTGPGRCHLRLDFCFLDDSAEAMQRNLADIEASAVLCAEDRAICERVQRNLESGAYDRGLLSPTHESAVAVFQERVRAAHEDLRSRST